MVVKPISMVVFVPLLRTYEKPAQIDDLQAIKARNLSEPLIIKQTMAPIASPRTDQSPYL
jgi:hypothetical protein